MPVSCWVPERRRSQQKPHKQHLLLAAAAPPHAAGPSWPPRAGLLLAVLGDASAESSILPLLLLERTCPFACPSMAGACSLACAPGGLGMGDGFMASEGKLSWSSLGGACMVSQVQISQGRAGEQAHSRTNVSCKGYHVAISLLRLHAQSCQGSAG